MLPNIPKDHDDRLCTLGRRVRAFSASDYGLTHGEVIAVAEFPTFVIRRDDGTTFTWAAHLTEVDDL